MGMLKKQKQQKGSDMGLDNIPGVYACVKQEVAIKTIDGLVDCEKTILAGKCPYVNEKQANPKVRDIQPVSGWLGTECWYRGKYGNYLLDLFKSNDSDVDYSFYGAKENDGMDSVESIEFSQWMKDNTEKFAYIVSQETESIELVKQWIFAAWWLEFVALNCEGFETWY
jgi:hypothetical protein